MARCQRCNGCTSMWDMGPCPHCNYPSDDTRTAQQRAEDDELMLRFEACPVCGEDHEGAPPLACATGDGV